MRILAVMLASTPQPVKIHDHLIQVSANVSLPLAGLGLLLSRSRSTKAGEKASEMLRC